jgi:ABC-type sugar transport system permease subunit
MTALRRARTRGGTYCVDLGCEIEKGRVRARRGQAVWYLFVGPMILGLILFHAYPIIESIRLSLYKSNLVNEVFRGARNYEITLGNALFWKGVTNTVYLGAWQLVLSIPLAFIVASVINGLTYGKNTVKTLYFVPYVTPMVAAAYVFVFVVDYQGLLNAFTGLIGLPALEWLRYPVSSQWAVILFNLWKGMGYTIMIVLAALQAIPNEYYEAAAIDGASHVGAWWHITVPNMRFTLYFLLINGMIGMFQRFADVFAIGGDNRGTLGGAERALYTVVMFIYERGFGSYDFGVASAAANLLFLMILILTLISVKTTKLFSTED